MNRGYKWALGALAIIFTLWWIFGAAGCGTTTTADGLTRYEIEAGESNAEPGESWFWFRRPSRFEIRGRFDTSAYYSLADWNGDSDWYDTNKFKGLTEAISANNKRAAFIGWRPSDSLNQFFVYAYTNDETGGFKTGPALRVRAGEDFAATIEWANGNARYTIMTTDGRATTDHKLADPRRLLFWREAVRESGTWFGGANNDPEGKPFGGVAHKPMIFFAKTIRN